jgi:hypothetical protein
MTPVLLTLLIVSGVATLIGGIATAVALIKNPPLPTQIEGRLERTKQLVEYMERLLKNPKRIQGMTIRIQAGLSSLARVGYPESEEPQDREYGEWLEKERDRLIELLEKGATLKVILTRPLGPLANRLNLANRLEQLIKFLNRQDDLINRCEFVISTEGGANLWFFGEMVLFEGHKTKVGEGYDLTIVYTNPKELSIRLSVFDSHFESAREYTLKTFGSPDDPKSNPETLRRAVIRALEWARKVQEHQ